MPVLNRRRVIDVVIVKLLPFARGSQIHRGCSYTKPSLASSQVSRSFQNYLDHDRRF
jgi:hypothetical protein